MLVWVILIGFCMRWNTFMLLIVISHTLLVILGIFNLVMSSTLWDTNSITVMSIWLILMFHVVTYLHNILMINNYYRSKPSYLMGIPSDIFVVSAYISFASHSTKTHYPSLNYPPSFKNLTTTSIALLSIFHIII